MRKTQINRDHEISILDSWENTNKKFVAFSDSEVSKANIWYTIEIISFELKINCDKNLGIFLYARSIFYIINSIKCGKFLVYVIVDRAVLKKIIYLFEPFLNFIGFKWQRSDYVLIILNCLLLSTKWTFSWRRQV